MRRYIAGMAVSLLMLFPLSGCGAIGAKSTSMSTIYGAMAVLSLLLLLGCFFVMRRSKDKWLLVLFASVMVVNTGYFALSVSQTVETALWANRLSYLGSVFLPLSMLMNLLNTSGLRHRKRLPAVLIALSVVVFLITATPGYLDIYYRDVSLATVNGVTVLRKEYGPWHDLYLFYLIAYCVTMIGVIIHAALKRKLVSPGHAAILTTAVGVNIGVWLLEQLVRMDFEFLSVSYIISELFLLGLSVMVQENQKQLSAAEVREDTAAAPLPEPAEEPDGDIPAEEPEAPEAPTVEDRFRRFEMGLRCLTQTERAIYELHIAGRTTKEIMAERSISENTLKFHNKNLYSKLGVSSRRELKELQELFQQPEREAPQDPV